jgi:hypothetical protein
VWVEKKLVQRRCFGEGDYFPVGEGDKADRVVEISLQKE